MPYVNSHLLLDLPLKYIAITINVSSVWKIGDYLPYVNSHLLLDLTSIYGPQV